VTVADAGKFFVLMGHTKLRDNDRETWVGSESQEGGADVSGPSEGNKKVPLPCLRLSLEGPKTEVSQ
jgi:hypothetical protein